MAPQTHLVGGAHSFAALSVNTPLDRTDAAALTPDGRLHLALTGDTRERLGLVGTRSATSPGALPLDPTPLWAPPPGAHGRHARAPGPPGSAFSHEPRCASLEP